MGEPDPTKANALLTIMYSALDSAFEKNWGSLEVFIVKDLFSERAISDPYMKRGKVTQGETDRMVDAYFDQLEESRTRFVKDKIRTLFGPGDPEQDRRHEIAANLGGDDIRWSEYREPIKEIMQTAFRRAADRQPAVINNQETLERFCDAITAQELIMNHSGPIYTASLMNDLLPTWFSHHASAGRRNPFR